MNLTEETSERWSSRRLLLGFLALVLFAMAATFFRSPSWFLNPPLYCEDGLFFAYYRNNDGLHHILWFYRGYVSLLPNAVAYLTQHVPATLGPTLLSGWALVAGAFARSAFALPRFRSIVASDRARWLLSLVIAAWPIGDFAMSHTGVYSLWHLLWILILFSMAPRSEDWRREAPVVLLQAACICSHPLSLFTAPLMIVQSLRSRRPVTLVANGVLLATLGLYQWLGVEHAQTAKLALSEVFLRSAHLIAARVVVEPLIGARWVVDLQAGGLTWVVYALAGAILSALVSLVFLHRRKIHHAQQWTLLWLAYFAICITVTSVMSRGLSTRPEIWEQRYYFLQQLSILIAGGVIATAAFDRWVATRMRRAAGALIVLAWCVVLHVRNGYAFWEVEVRDAEKVATFLQQVQEAERQEPTGEPRRVVLRRGVWSLEVRVE